MRTPQHLAWLRIADGALAVALVWRWAFRYGPHHVIDGATIVALMVGVLEAAPAAVRSLRGTPRPTPDRAPWLTILADGVVMIALAWQWAFNNQPYTVLGAVTLSTLMVGFLHAAATALETLGRAGEPIGPDGPDAEENALLLFPVERSADRM